MNSYPLFVKDPYFSIWSAGNNLQNSDITFWTGAKKELYGFAIVDGVDYSFLSNRGLHHLKQTSVETSIFKTTYIFQGEDFSLVVEFVSPLLLDELDTLSRPVCYLRYRFETTAPHSFGLSLFLGKDWCGENAKDKEVQGGICEDNGTKMAWIGLKKQKLLLNYGDREMPNWGFYYLAGSSAKVVYDLKDKGVDGLPTRINGISTTSFGKNGLLLIAHDDVFAIDYFGFQAKDYYARNGEAVIEAISKTKKSLDSLEIKMNKIDLLIRKNANNVSPNYYQVCCASYRQTIGAHKLIQDQNGNLAFISKECCSNGSAATVDVSFPSFPLFYIFNPELIKAMISPIFFFARSELWDFPFAPHDVGVFPLCIGQRYGFSSYGRKLEKEKGYPWMMNQSSIFCRLSYYDSSQQMPVEESSNMIILSYLYYLKSHNVEFIKDNFDLLSNWETYLEVNGKRPSNQLCTDDFAGHLDLNINLSIKATIAISCFSHLEKEIGSKVASKRCKLVALSFASYIDGFSKKIGFLPLTFSTNDYRFSTKYNLALDLFLELGLFPKSLYKKEEEIYRANLKKYGLPLDGRKAYAKSDWEMWVASFSSPSFKSLLINSLVSYIKVSPTRTPFPDWYETETAKAYDFRNRSVQGGCFFPLLSLNKDFKKKHFPRLKRSCFIFNSAIGKK